MALYVITKPNPYLPLRTYVESFDDGCLKIKFEQKGNRMIPTGHEGIMLPTRELRPFMMKVVKNGLDKWHDR